MGESNLFKENKMKTAALIIVCCVILVLYGIAVLYEVFNDEYKWW